MRASRVTRDAPSLEERLSELDVQLRAFEASLRSQQQGHSRIRGLELELAGVVERGAAIVRDLAAIRDEVQRAAETAAREAATPAADQLKSFEERGRHLLDAFAQAVRAAHQAVARAEARVDAFDERVGRELAQAGKEIREAAELLRHSSLKEAAPLTGVRRFFPALLAAALLVLAFAGYLWFTRTLRDASARADSAERQAADVKRESDRQIASIDRKAEQVSQDALKRAVQAERATAIVAAPDVRRMPMRGYGKAADAWGQALWSPTHGLAIMGSQLPVLSDGETYQLWLVTARDSVSLGVLAPDSSGRINGVFDLPSGIRAVTGFMITRERARGAQRPSTAVVLAT
jgi:anti-sigma-K factor RskA